MRWRGDASYFCIRSAPLLESQHNVIESVAKCENSSSKPYSAANFHKISQPVAEFNEVLDQTLKLLFLHGVRRRRNLHEIVLDLAHRFLPLAGRIPILNVVLPSKEQGGEIVGNGVGTRVHVNGVRANL